MENKSSYQIDVEREGSATSKQTLIFDVEGANLDSLKEIRVDSESDKPVIDFRIKYPESKTDCG